MSQVFNAGSIDPAVTTPAGLGTITKDALLALQSNFSGLTAPASPVAGQPWCDTTAGRMKIRNSANTAWIDKGAIDVSIDEIIEARVGDFALDTGTANAKVIALNPAISAYTGNFSGSFKNAVLNTSACTINAGGGAVELVNDAGAALVAGDLPAGAIVTYQYIHADAKAYVTSLVLSQALTQAAVDTLYLNKIQSIGASVSANALTATSAATVMDFRNATLTNGAPIAGVTTGAGSIVVQTGATLGTVNGVAARLVLLTAYNAGTPVLCIVNLAGGLQLDETNLISPTTISAGATAANVIYSASAVAANSPYRIRGYIDITEATAGTWATGATAVQGTGGEVRVDVGAGVKTASVVRTSGVAYYNTSKFKKTLIVTGSAPSGVAWSETISINDGPAVTYGQCYAGTQASYGVGCVEIPPLAKYVTTTAAGTRISTSEIA